MSTNQSPIGNANPVTSVNPSQAGQNVNNQPAQKVNPANSPQPNQPFTGSQAIVSPTATNQTAAGISTQTITGAQPTQKSKMTRIYECVKNSINGISDKEISETLNLSISMVNQYCRKLVLKGLIDRRDVEIDIFNKRTRNFPVALVDGLLPEVSAPQSSAPSGKWKKLLGYLQSVQSKTKDMILEEALLDYSRKMNSSDNA